MASSAPGRLSPKRPAQPTVAPATKKRKLDKELTTVNNGATWITRSFIQKEDAQARWPKRRMEGLPEPAEADGDVVARAHFEAIEIEDVGTVRLGDFVEVDPEEDSDRLNEAGRTHRYVMQVKELFQDTEGVRMLDGHWFYKTWDTALRVRTKDKQCLPGDFDPDRLFRSSDADNAAYETLNPVDTIHAKVRVTRVNPGQARPPPAAAPEVLREYWYDQEHDRRHITFIDSFTAPPASSEQRPQSVPRVMRALDLYSGCGGLSFVDRHTERVQLDTRWAVDYEPDMCSAFQANYPGAQVFPMGVDEWLALCMHFKRLSDAYPEGWVDPEGDASSEDDDEPPPPGEYEVERILSVHLIDSAKRGQTGQAKGHLMEPLDLENTWLEFRVKWKGYEALDDEDGLVKESQLQCPAKVAEFVARMRREQAIPLPGQVDLVMGGPPCQGVSGLNRHSKTQDIINDSRNRQVQAFYDVIQWFKPAFVLMENVMDIFHKQNGMYVKFAVGRLLNMRYQTRVGCIAAADQGAPQGRWRAFLWGALAGQEQLPPFPEPSHFASWQCGVPELARQSVVGFTSEDARAAAHTMNFMGDILSDLPNVTSFGIAEARHYQKGGPKTPLQLWLRRDPPAWQASREQRARAADAAMAETNAHLSEQLRQLAGCRSFCEMVGRSVMCKKGSTDTREGGATEVYFSQQTFRKVMEAVLAAHPRDKAALEQEWAASEAALAHTVGAHILQEAADAVMASGPLRDHRPLYLNMDDYLRVCAVPKRKDANFRDYPGVVEHDDGTCCAGHTHAAKKGVEGKTACRGGGTRTEAPRGISKHSRVDHHDKEGWRGGILEGCEAATALLPTRDLLCPRWCITYKAGRSTGRHGCFGRLWYDEVQPTVVGRAEPHNLRVIHPNQGRVVTVRENARCQGFPDYFVLVGTAPPKSKGWVRSRSLTNRYQQMGNAVCPLVAAALGRCLELAAAGAAPVGVPVVAVRDPQFDQTMAKAKELGLESFVEAHGMPAAYDKMLAKKAADPTAQLELAVLGEDEDGQGFGVEAAGGKEDALDEED